MDTSSFSYPVPPDAVLEVCLCHGSRRAARVLTRIYDASLASFGLKSGQFALLTAIAAAAPLSITRLGEIMAMDPSTLSRNLKPLQRSGYVAWSGGAGRRAGQLSLTDGGRRCLATAMPAWQAAQSRVADRLGSGNAGTLLQNLESAARAGDL